MTIRKLFKAEIAHRLVNSYSKKCQSIHGHSYKFEIKFEGDKLLDNEMLFDFGRVKDTINQFMDAWDHTMVFSHADPLLYAINMEQFTAISERVMIVNYNPTAEMMAQHIAIETYNLLKQLKTSIGEYMADCLCEVIVHETDTGYASQLVNPNWVELYGRDSFDVWYSEALNYKEASCSQ